MIKRLTSEPRQSVGSLYSSLFGTQPAAGSQQTMTESSEQSNETNLCFLEPKEGPSLVDEMHWQLNHSLCFMKRQFLQTSLWTRAPPAAVLTGEGTRAS